MIPDPTQLPAEASHWLIVAVKALTALGFMTAADFIVLYAC
jgi:hypothetical protein